MALPPLVVSGQIISAAHINSIRNHLGTWSTTVSAGGNDLTNVGTLSANVGAFGGSITAVAISAANIGAAGQISATTALISGATSVGSLASTGAVTASDLTVTGVVTAASNVLTPGLRLTGSAFKYLECESPHLAFTKATGAYPYYWRRSSNGHTDGSGLTDLMTLDDSGNLAVTSNYYGKVFVSQGLSVASPVSSEIVFSQAGISDTDAIYLEQMTQRMYAGSGQQTVESRLRRKVGATPHGYVGFGSAAGNAPYVSVGQGNGVEWVRFNTGAILIRPQVSGGNEGGEVQLADPSGANNWHIDNYSQGLRMFRTSTAPCFNISPTGTFTIGNAAVNSYCKVSVADALIPYSSAASGLGSFKVGGAAQLDQGIIFGNQNSGGLAYGWMQAITPGTVNLPMMINGNGGGVVLGSPAAAVSDTILPASAFSFYVDEVNHRLYVRVRESNGTMRTGFIQI